MSASPHVAPMLIREGCDVPTEDLESAVRYLGQFCDHPLWINEDLPRSQVVIHPCDMHNIQRHNRMLLKHLVMIDRVRGGAKRYWFVHQVSIPSGQVSDRQQDDDRGRRC